MQVSGKRHKSYIRDPVPEAPHEVLRASDVAAAAETRLPIPDRLARFRRRPPKQSFQQEQEQTAARTRAHPRVFTKAAERNGRRAAHHD